MKPRGPHKSDESDNSLCDGSESDSDGHDSLHSLFSGDPDVDSADTELTFEDNSGLDKRSAENTSRVSKRLRAGDSSGKNHVKFHTGRTLIGGRSTDCTGQRCPESEFARTCRSPQPDM